MMADSEELWTYPWLKADTVFPVSFIKIPGTVVCKTCKMLLPRVQQLCNAGTSL